MREDLAAQLPLICVACRSPEPVRLAAASRRDGAEILEGILACDRCSRRYAIVDRIPILVRDPAAWMARHAVAFAEPSLSADVANIFLAGATDDTPLARRYELLSTYLDAHWGDHATPPVTHAAALYERVAARSTERVPLAIELGANVGRGVFELSRGADLTVGIDISLDSLRRARVVLDGGELPHARRMMGRHYAEARIAAPRAPGRVELVCADVLDPPVLPARFDRVMALNMLEAVTDPPALLAVLAGLCAPKGELMCSSSYAWQTGFVHEARRIGREDAAADVVRMLTWERGLSVEDNLDVDITLRRDARNAATSRVHWLRLRR